MQSRELGGSDAVPLGAVVAELAEGVLVESAQGTVALVNPAFCGLFGLDRDAAELIGADVRVVMAAVAEWFADPIAHLDRIDAITWAGQTVRRERLVLVDGRCLERDYVPIRGAGAVPRHAWIHRDMTREAAALQALREREARLGAVIDVAPGLVWSADSDRRLVLYNQRFADGFERGQGFRPLPGASLIDVRLSPEERAWWVGLYARAFGGERAAVTFDEQVPGWNGNTYDITIAPVVNDARITGAAVFMHDVTENRRNMLRQRRLNQVLDTLTRLQARFIDEADTGAPFSELLDTLLVLTGSRYGLLAEAEVDADPPRLVASAVVEGEGRDGRAGDVAGEAPGRRARGSIARVTVEAAAAAARTTGFFTGPAVATAAAGLDPDHPPLGEAVALPCFSGDRLMGLVLLAGRPHGYDAAALADLPPLLNCCAGLIDAQHNERRRRHAEEALKLAKESAEAADRAKGDFLASMSHEIRTPLNAVIGLTELALDAAVSDDQRGLLRAAAANSETLLRLISDILDFSRIEAGLVELDLAPFELRRLVEEVAELMAVRADEKGLELVADIEPSLPSSLIGDAHRLRQVVTNLVSNAIKFTDDGSVVVEVRATPAPDGQVAVRLAVRDTGCGIPIGEQEQVFDRFHRVAATAARGEDGTGLGLAIVRSLVSAMNGQISVVSTPGAGSLFTVDLTLPRAARGTDDGVDPSALARVTVLVVHPSGPTERWISTTLAACGAEVWVASDAAEAAERIRDHAIDVVLTALTLPFATGIPRVWLASVGEFDRRGREARLTLPARRDSLLRATLDAAGRQRMYSSPPMPPRPSPKTPRLALLVEDHDDNREVARRLIEAHGHHVDTAPDGEAALALIRAVDYDVVLMDLHMPRLDGFETVRRLRSEEARARVTRTPVVAITAHATEAVRQRCLEGGFDGFVPKPVTGALLHETIERHARDEAIALVVDDAADSRRLLVRYLRRHTPLRVRQAADANEALEIAAQCSPVLALIDAVLPGTSGFDLARSLRERLGPHTVLIMVTGRTGAEPRRLAEAAGCDGFVTKPVRRVELMSTIEALLALGLPQPETEPPVARVDHDLLDLIPPFLDDRRRDLARIDTALAGSDFAVIKRLGHSMRGTGSAYGMTEISRLGALLEEAAAAADGPRCHAVRDLLAAYVEQVQVVGDAEG